MRSHLSFANVLSALALFIALGGGAYAATLPRNSVGTAQLKGNAVNSAKVKDGSLQRGDFAAGEIPSIQGTVRGETGAAGPKGDTGAKGDKGDPGAAGAPGAAGKDGSQGLAGATGADGIGLNGFFGNGFDGDQTFATNLSLSRDMYFDDLTLGTGANLNTQGFRLFVAGTLTMGNNARIHRNGNNAQVNSGGAELPAQTLGSGGAGIAAAGFPSCVNTLQQTSSLGGAGSPSGCGAGAGAARPAATEGGETVLFSAAQALTGRTLDGTRINGGAGGGSGSGAGNTGGSGGGGGVVVVAARRIALTGIATISATGGNAVAGGTGAPGGGGVVIVVSTTPKPETLTVSAAGGTPTGIPGRTVYLN